MKKEKMIMCNNCATPATASVEGRYLCAGCLMNFLMGYPEPEKLAQRLIPVNRPDPATEQKKMVRSEKPDNHQSFPF